MSWRASCGLLLVVWMEGCALWHPPLASVDQAELAWLRGLDGWQLQGRVGVRSERGSWHGGVRWIYRNGLDRLILSGPFGQGGMVIQARPAWIRVEQADGRIRFSDRPEGLLEEVLGVAVPLGLLHHWVRGLPAPGPVKTSYGPDGRLWRLTQGGWQIEYLEYRPVGPGALPVKLVLTGPGGVHLKLIVDRWEVKVESEQA